MESSTLMLGTRTLPAITTRYAPAWPYLRWGLFGIAFALLIGVLIGVVPYASGTFGDGSAFYYGTDTPYDWSDWPVEYRYSPAFLWVTEPLRLVPFEVYRWIWTALHVLAILWLSPPMLAFPGVFDDAVSGNINTFLAVAAVVALRPRPAHAAAWAFVLLTKVTPGVGVLAHIRRGQWSSVRVTLGATAAIFVVGAFLSPDVWMDWLRSLTIGSDTYPNVWTASLPFRVLLGAFIAWRGPLWAVPVAMLVAVPGLWPSSFAVLAAMPRLMQARQSRASTA